MESGGGGGDTFTFVGEDGLVAGDVEIVFVGGAFFFDVGGERDAADVGEDFGGEFGRGDGDFPHAFGVEAFGEVEAVLVFISGEEFVSEFGFAAGAEEDFPCAGFFFGEEEAGDGSAGGFAEKEFGGKDAGVVVDEEVGGEEIVGQVIKVAVLDFTGGTVIDEEAAVIARFGGSGGDAVGRK